ncbi:ATPase [Psychrobacter pacificensis]|uniref:Polyphosphate kinase 2, PPK2 family n=1 Tax=Psychrobacter pacificensis TaxID=112002 RepID=A0A1G6VMY3_9GAMM|nr:ATPase [Psychrobacter pacificensis]GLR28427.1 polyphosphate--AMP phosphotransferase [Psychrobacter pacificensis]SDD54235.1 Polyphosphate kinase 2, PPK2 family [Psychrobacter pacificensis]HBD03293.1 ATPase [Psychrobacter sp.]
MSQKNDTTEPEAPQAVSSQFSEQVVEERLTPNPLSQFSMDKDALRLALVTAQYALRATRQQTPPTLNKPTGLLVLVNGMEQAGKGTAVKQLRQWVDPRLLKVEATVGHAPLSYQPIWQVHTGAMPRHGDVMVYFGNWYADLLYNVMRIATSNNEDKKKQSKNQKHIDKNALPIAKWQAYLQQQLAELKAFEQDLIANHTRLLKCWFHVDMETLHSRLQDSKADPQFLYQIDWNSKTVIEKFNEVAATLLRQQDDWIIIDGDDKSAAADDFCHEVLHAMQMALVSSRTSTTESAEKKPPSKTKKSKPKVEQAPFEPVKIPKSLTNIDDSKISKSEYNDALAKKQTRLAELLRARQGRHVVFAFEGMDAAGKGGAIKRLVAALDPREYQIYNIGAPMLYETQHPYLWRFWTKLPNEQTNRVSRIAIFDRTWYGRVLVERVEGFATDEEWQRAYDEINRFESDLTTAGTLVIKYWLAIDKKEQLKRFEARQDTPHKQFKLTDDDWRNRDKWSDYVQSAADMLARTNTKTAPWCIIATNEKRQARLDVLDHAIQQLSEASDGN